MTLTAYQRQAAQWLETREGTGRVLPREGHAVSSLNAPTLVTGVTPVRAIAEMELDAKRRNHPKHSPQRKSKGKPKEKPSKER